MFSIPLLNVSLLLNQRLSSTVDDKLVVGWLYARRHVSVRLVEPASYTVSFLDDFEPQNQHIIIILVISS